MSSWQVLNQDETPLLYSLVFGEGVVNDATSVVLFNAIQRFDLSHITSTIATEFFVNFFYLFLTSTVLGIVVSHSLSISISLFFSVSVRAFCICISSYSSRSVFIFMKCFHENLHLKLSILQGEKLGKLELLLPFQYYYEIARVFFFFSLLIIFHVCRIT